MAIDTATLQARLLEAELAYHRLQIGVAEVECQHDNLTVKYTMASVDKLRLYIADLKSQLVAAGTLDSTAIGRRRPMYVQL